MPVRRKCAVCGRDLPLGAPLQRKYCSHSDCVSYRRRLAGRKPYKSKKAILEVELPATEEFALLLREGVVRETWRWLALRDQLETPLGRAAMVLAFRLNGFADESSAVIARVSEALRDTLAAIEAQAERVPDGDEWTVDRLLEEVDRLAQRLSERDADNREVSS